MRRVLIAAMVVTLAAGSYGQMLSAGTQELKVEGLLDFDTADGTLIDLGLFYGQFIVDYIELGMGVHVRDSDSQTMWRLGVAGEMNFDLGTEFVPYLGLGLAYAKQEIEVETGLDGDETEDEDAVIVSGSGGAKFFIAENIAISGALVIEWASEEIYAEDDQFEDSDFRIELAMRFFF